ncbi:MAG TPA: hypothetical protein VFA20_31975 [Myxococcaceae bacterium]|nr:hypothetical protein [Myxococcaceae bacterium]
MRYRLAAAAASLSLFVGCIAHEKEGDSAAATGDWKSAYVHYRDALQEKAETPGLKPKFDNARTQALAQSRQQANTCLQQRDWACVGSEAQFILSVEPGAPDAAQMKAQASLYQAMDVLQQARGFAAQRNFGQAADAVKRAREMSNAPEVQAEAGRVQMEIVAAAVAESDRLRQERQYDQAVQAMQVAVQYDPSQAQRLRDVQDEREKWIAYQYEKTAYDGDVALSQRDWRTASERYRAATAMRPGGRADGLARYCDAMANADAALQNRSYDAAAQAYQEAVNSGADKGEARAALEKLRIRPYDVAIRSVLLVPTKPDGNPWTGPITPLFFKVAQFVQQHLQSRHAERAVEMAMTIPNENRPELHVEVMMPNGSVLATRPVKGIYATFDGDLVINSNGYDDRHLLFRVVQHGNGPEVIELGRLDVAMRDLCDAGDIAMTSDNVSQLRVTAKPADGRQEGAFGLTQVTAATTAVAAAPPPPNPGGPPGGPPAGAAPPPPPPPPGPGTSGSVVVTGGAPGAGHPVNAGGAVTYVPPPKPPPPTTPAPVAAPPPPKPPPVAPPMAPAVPAPPPGQGTHGPTPVGAPPPAPPATHGPGAPGTPPPPPASGGTAVSAPPAGGGQAAPAPGNEDDDDQGKGHGKGKGKGKKVHRGRAIGHEKDD